MSKLLLFVLLFSKDTIITNLVPNSTTIPAPLTLRIVSTSSTPLKNLSLQWSVQTGGIITKTGKATVPLLTPNHPILVRLPSRLPDDTASESFLRLRYRSATTLLADQQILLRPWRPRLSIPPAGKISCTDTGDIFTIQSTVSRISFNRQTGWLMHYEIKGVELLDDSMGLRSNFWWPGYNDSATIVNDSANVTTDSGWLAATREPHLQLFSNTTSAEQVIIRTEYTLPATASLLHISYTINAAGEMLVTQQVEPDTTQPASRPWQLPCFGMQWILPPGFDSIAAYGPARANANPDPTAIRIFRDYPAIPAPGDPDPRATSIRTNIRWCSITDKRGNGLQFIADTNLLNESALHCFDRDLMIISQHSASATAALPKAAYRPQIQLSIDRPAPPSPSSPSTLPFGNYQYTYKVKPLGSSTPN